MKRVVASIDLDALHANLEVLRARAGGADLMAVVKADAYGHGMIPIARAARAAGIAWLGVALPSEAMRLRDSGDAGRLLAWLWAPHDADVERCVAADVDLSVSSVWAVEEVVQAARSTGRVARVHLKVDTGLTRNGVTMAELPAVLDALRGAVAEGVLVVEAMWSHLADGDTPDADSVRDQRARFEEAWSIVRAAGVEPRIRHLANSGALFAHPDCHYDLVRTGIAMYGLTPALGLGTADSLGLTPVMTLAATLAHVKDVPAGTSVSYGWRWTAQAQARLALVPAGYADGIPRAAGAPRSGPAVEVTVEGERCPIVGTVAMDQFVIDAGGVPSAAAGSSALLFGPGTRGECTADEWAQAMGTIGYEIVTRIGPRVEREYVERDDAEREYVEGGRA